MNPAVKTLVFAGVALVSTIAAIGAHKSYQVDLTRKFTDEGTEFFPDFDPAKATSLQVAAYDKTNARVNDFKVEFRDGRWRIPSHNDYPADGKDRLFQTAASMIGVKREVQVGTSADDHRRVGLVDPLSNKSATSDGVGTRITIKDGDSVLVDYVVGNKIENVGADVYYIRKADEDRYYRANLGKFEISTKFADWIEPDLLQVAATDIKELGIDRFKIDFLTREQSEQETSDLKREKQGGDWTLDGLDSEKEKVKTSVVNEIVNSIDDLKIVGVRRKPPALAALLRGEQQKVTQSELLELQLDMQSKGYLLQKGIIPTSGSVSVGTYDGVSYRLDFGNVFSGSDVEIEVGGKGEKERLDAAKTEASSPDEAGQKPEESEKPADNADDKKDDKLTKNRFVFIQTRFDEKLLAEAPQPPVKPEPPKDEPSAPAEAKDEAKSEESKPDPANSETKDAAAEAEKPPAAKPSKEESQKKYEEALKEYELQKEVYETRKKEYDEKIAATKKKVERLNDRFADWYFVVADSVYEGLRVKRSDLSEAKEPAKAPAAGNAPMIPEIPGLPGFPLPGGKNGDAKEEGDQPANPSTSKDDAPKPEAPKPDAEPKPDPAKPADAPEAPDAATPEKPAKPAPDAAEDPAEAKPESEKPAEATSEEAKPETEPSPETGSPQSEEK